MEKHGVVIKLPKKERCSLKFDFFHQKLKKDNTLVYDELSQWLAGLKCHDYTIFPFVAKVTELCQCMIAWLIIKHVLLHKIMRFWFDSSRSVWCVLCGYGPVIFIVIWLINSRAGWVKIWQYTIYMIYNI